jgi:diacylglycerol kinase
MNFSRFIDSVRYAWRGLRYVYAHEQNFRIQLLIAVLVCVLMWFLGMHRGEIVVVCLIILLILLLELLNSAFERFIDILKPRLHFQVEIVKDIMAAAVLIAGFGAVVIGGIIFYPYIIDLFSY